ncbi:MAG TPA: glycosyltransferase [Tepidisphaeraceae bacterium]|jgi:glycosyltransferase involved in cell wall biosynthesis|nr:glycosyltransferase [Tepidisphaeraceae bacterium]
MPRRLLLLNTDLEIGGTPTVVRELALRLRSSEVQTHVACLAALGPVGADLTAAGVPVTAFDARSRFDLSVLPRLIWLLRRDRFDAILSFLVHANAIAALAHTWHRGGAGRWFQSIQTTQPTPRWHWHLQALAARSAEKIIVPSPSVAWCAMHWADVPAEKLVVIPNGLTMEEFTPSPGTPGEGRGVGFREEAAPTLPCRNYRWTRGGEKSGDKTLAQSPLRIGFIGRLDPVKRIGDLVAATAILGQGYRLDIFGEGVERPRIEAQIAALQLMGRATLRGAIARPAEALANMDVLVLPSAAEGFGLVLIEAMAAGVPVVASDAPGICDVVSPGPPSQTGLLVPVGAISALAAAIRSVRDDPAAWRERTAEARREVERRYTWSRVVPMYRAVLGLS